MIRAAIIDASCRLSAFPTPQEFLENDYITKGCAVITCEVEESLVPVIWANRYNCYVLPAGTPVPADLPVDAYVLSMDLNLKIPALVQTA